jgi:hypothetical protein
MVERTMTRNLTRIMLFFITLLFISQLPFFSTNARRTGTTTEPTSEPAPDLLVILSPQYARDTDITTAIRSYGAAVTTDLGWTTRLIPLQEKENEYHSIDALIEATYHAHPLKACIMVGEDLSTPLGGDADYLEQPSTLPWATLGGNTSYDLTTQGILCTPTTIDICISLLYPTHALTYEQKKSCIISAFHKFTTHRHSSNPHAICVFESTNLNTNSKTLYQTLDRTTTLTYTEDASDQEIRASVHQNYTAFFVHGHSTPAGTDVNTQDHTGWFTAQYLDQLHTPFFGADGCYTGGWWSNQTNNNQLDPSIDADWYGSKIFSSPAIQVMALGLLSQTGFSQPVSFLENIFPKLLQGKTLAEAMIGETSIGDTIIVGDPTFHFL